MATKVQLTFPQKQAKRGYILAFRLSQLLRKHHSTIYRWSQLGKVDSERVGDQHWIKLESVRTHLGEDAFKTYKLDKMLARMKEGNAA